MDEIGNVNLYISEGADGETIVKEMGTARETVPRDAFGNTNLDAANPRACFVELLAEIGQPKGYQG